MAFSMNQVKRKTVTKQDNIKQCLKDLGSNQILTENIKYAVWQYAEYRFNKRNHSTFTSKRLMEMTNDLLEHIIQKPYSEITWLDVLNNENKIIYEIGRAIFYGAIHNLYYTGNDTLTKDNINLRKDLDNEPIRLPDDKKLEKQEVINYFKGLII